MTDNKKAPSEDGANAQKEMVAVFMPVLQIDLSKLPRGRFPQPLPKRSECKCSCHHGGGMHIQGCCKPD